MDNDSAIAEIANGSMLKQIAARYGVSKIAVYKRLKDHPDYPEAMSLQAHALVQDSVQQVMECDAETVNIARARADITLRYAKAHSEAYRDRQIVDVNHNVKIDMDSVGAASALLTSVRTKSVTHRTIDAESVKTLDLDQESKT